MDNRCAVSGQTEYAGGGRLRTETGPLPNVPPGASATQRLQIGTSEDRRAGADAAAAIAGIPEDVRATAMPRRGEYDARRLRCQREIIRDVMLAAADCGTWLTLGELHALTHYGEASISAQLRHLRRAENGGYDVRKRHREGATPARLGTDGRGECVWEYCVLREMIRES